MPATSHPPRDSVAARPSPITTAAAIHHDDRHGRATASASVAARIDAT